MTTKLENIEPLLEWFAQPSNRSFFNRDVLEVKKSPVSDGVGVFARMNRHAAADDEEENVLLRVHKSMVLSPQTCTISNLLCDWMDNVEEMLPLNDMSALVLAYLFEVSLGEKSPWYVYLQSFQVGNAMPLCLQDDKRVLSVLRGSEVDVMGGLDKSELESHYEACVDFARYVCERTGMEVPSELNGDDLTGFGIVYSCVASRAFEVDEYIPLALVPGADLFNHAVGGEGSEHVHFVTLGDVCGVCGKTECTHREEEEGDEDEEEDEEEMDVDEEDNAEEEEDVEELTMDYVVQMEKELEEEKQAEEDNDSESEDEDEEEEYDNPEWDPKEMYMDPDECCDIVIAEGVQLVRGREVFNTYGDLPNAVLLAKYGFAIEDNPCESVCLGAEVNAFRREHPELEPRWEWWKQQLKEEEDSDEEEEEEDDEEEESWLLQCRVDAPGVASAALCAVARLAAMDASAFEEVETRALRKKLGKSDVAARKLVAQWAAQRVAQYSAEGRSGALLREARKNQSKGSGAQRRAALVAVAGEKALLEKVAK